MPFVLINVANSSAMNCGPLSVTTCSGSPYVANKDQNRSTVFVHCKNKFVSATQIVTLTQCHVYICTVDTTN